MRRCCAVKARPSTALCDHALCALVPVPHDLRGVFRENTRRDRMMTCNSAVQWRVDVAATMLDCSSDGVLSHVLPRLSDEALLASACVSREWKSLVDDTLYGTGLRAQGVRFLDSTLCGAAV